MASEQLNLEKPRPARRTIPTIVYFAITFLILGLCTVHLNLFDSTLTENTPLTHYGILNLSTGATENEIKHAYRKKVALYHPDKWQRLGAEAQEGAKRKFNEITTSYELLLSEGRCGYDHHIMNGSVEQYDQCKAVMQTRKLAESERKWKREQRQREEEREQEREQELERARKRKLRSEQRRMKKRNFEKAENRRAFEEEEKSYREGGALINWRYALTWARKFMNWVAGFFFS
ncbi:hypothetical protein F4678DRAFT_465942 [Xylaria arbuscula]|nr:hypothetical protein F4678DRAFT_465942 [Xylaria arbuscula]